MSGNEAESDEGSTSSEELGQRSGKGGGGVDTLSRMLGGGDSNSEGDSPDSDEN